MEAIIFRWIFSVFYSIATLLKAIDEIYFFDIDELPLFLMVVGSVILIVVNRKAFSNNLLLALIPLLLIQISALIYDLSWYGINIWDQVVRLLFSIVILILFSFSKGKKSVPIKYLLKDYLAFRLTENHFIKDKVSITFALIMGSTVGIGCMSFLDALFRDNGPYRVPFDMFILCLSSIIFILAVILYVVCLVKSREISVWNRLKRLAFVFALAVLITIPSAYLWYIILQLAQTVKGIIYYDLMGNPRI